MTTNTVQRINFEPVSDILATQRRDFPLATPALADPLNALALVDGEWMILNSSYQIARACSASSAGNVATQTSYILFAERGRYDVRALSGTKMPIIMMGELEADTRIYDATATIGAASGAAIASVGQPLKVGSITIGTRVYVGLVGHGTVGVDTDPIVGRVTRLPADNGGKLRFIRACNY